MNDQSVYEQALRWLARRSHGERELARRLRETGAPPEAVERALARCRELGYLDDAAFAASRARYRLEQGHGARRVQAELTRLGIDSAIVQEVMTDLPDEEETLRAAQRLLGRRFGETPPQDAREWKRRHDFLARRGFDAGIIAALLPAHAFYGSHWSIGE
ncbi:MAG: regulatory protein RecX [Magnetococcales bacterium]|nr:regulatory protein RecX [Magnetococcales bacterium]